MQENSVLALSVCLILADKTEWGNTGGKKLYRVKRVKIFKTRITDKEPISKILLQIKKKDNTIEK